MTELSPVPWSRRVLRVMGAGVLGGIVASVAGVAVHELAWGESYEVAQVHFDGAQRASPAELRHLADVRSGDHLLSVDLDAVARKVERHPWVVSATARRRLPSTIEVTVVEHEPVMLLALDKLWYVDANGVVFKSASTDDLDYPVLTGLDPTLASARPELARAVLLGALRVMDATAGRPALPVDDVSEIHHDPVTGFELVLRSGSRVVVGNGPPAPRLDRLMRLLESGVDLKQPQRIDLDLDNVAVTRPLARAGI